MHQKIKLFILGIFALFMDQISKYIVQNNFSLYESREIIPGFFNITYVLNPGAAFGIFSNQDALMRKIFLLVAAIVACIVILALLKKELNYKLRSYAYVMVIAGALGNALDRFRFDSVIDFLDFYYGSFHWYTFNIADCFITVGVFLLIFDMFLMNKGKF